MVTKHVSELNIMVRMVDRVEIVSFISRVVQIFGANFKGQITFCSLSNR